jgi:iron complex outermembrane receptor protein
MYKQYYIILIYLISTSVFSQKETKENLKEVVITSSRIELPFSKNSRTITIISSEDIKKSTATNIADLLQNIAGIDVRRRGTEGMQSDLYIRGGHFNQTLVLIDGIKTEDPQTGHHTMDMMLPIEAIERIEIIKGPAARIFGQNAFTGAINIVTKKQTKKLVKISSSVGSFDFQSVGITATTHIKKSIHTIHYSTQKSDGYRFNTDFNNQNYFLKSSFPTKHQTINVLATFAERKFGANNFYTNSPRFNEYEETQTSLVGVSTKINKNNVIIKPKIYWKRHQDEFLLRRNEPFFSRNLNISNKIGTELNTSLQSNIGVTGFGIDLANTSLSSNNLGNQNRFMLNAFLEHRFVLLNEKLDVTPGISVNYFSDFKFHSFPGLDLGYKVNNQFKLYANIGYSYRIPTYTELYINIPNFLSGNAELDPEQSLAEEIGFKYKKANFNLSSAFFRRDSEDLIDYVKETAASPFFLAQNLRKITTQGLELNVDYSFKISDLHQKMSFGYTFIDDDYDTVNVFASRYLINTSIKHQVTASLTTQFFEHLKQSVFYRYVERPTNSYSVVDAKISFDISQFNMYLLVNNIFNASYFEKDFVPMPKGNFVFGLSYQLD